MIEIDNLEEIVKKLNDLYVLYRKRFIVINDKLFAEGRNYIVSKQFQNKETDKILTDIEIKKHISQKQTIGVFAGTMFTKFICFDVDITNKENAKWTVYKLVDTLQNLGIKGEYIHISTSGNKGYHVEIFFDKPIENSLINQFYMMVLNTADLLNIDVGKVELRPKQGNAVKLPLGIHFKTKNTCWFCDFVNKLEPIKSYDYILNIKQMKTEDFKALLNTDSEDVLISEEQSQALDDIKDKYKPLGIYEQNVDEEVTIEAIEKLISEGLTRQGMRHNSLINIAKYNKYSGFSKLDNVNYLINWMKIQDQRMYTTKWDEVLKDIDLIIDWIYNNNISLVVRKQNIEISKSEIVEIMKIKSKNERVLLYSLMIHSKRYANKDGTFYMTYKQMMESTGLSKNTIIKSIRNFESNEFICCIRSNTTNYNPKLNKPITEPNTYKINLLGSILGISESNNFKVCDKNCINCFQACLCSFYTNDELKTMMTKHEYYNITKDRLMIDCINL